MWNIWSHPLNNFLFYLENVKVLQVWPGLTVPVSTSWHLFLCYPLAYVTPAALWSHRHMCLFSWMSTGKPHFPDIPFIKESLCLITVSLDASLSQKAYLEIGIFFLVFFFFLSFPAFSYIALIAFKQCFYIYGFISESSDEWYYVETQLTVTDSMSVSIKVNVQWIATVHKTS